MFVMTCHRLIFIYEHLLFLRWFTEQRSSWRFSHCNHSGL